MAIFNSYVSLPEGIHLHSYAVPSKYRHVTKENDERSNLGVLHHMSRQTHIGFFVRHAQMIVSAVCSQIVCHVA